MSEEAVCGKGVITNAVLEPPDSSGAVPPLRRMNPAARID